MEVSLPAHTLSRSVVSALEFASSDLEMKLVDVGVTDNFIRCFE